jgi:hypothetical protein
LRDLEHHAVAMQSQTWPSLGVTVGTTVEVVTPDRMANPGQVDAKLVGPTGLRRQHQQRIRTD